MCKDNYAASVKQLTPHWHFHEQGISSIYTVHSAFIRSNFLDTNVIRGIFIDTYIALWRLEIRSASKERPQTLEGRRPPRRGHVEPGTREGPRSEVLARRVLRSARCRAGQVRDVAPCLHRERVSDGRLRRIRCLEA